MKLKFTIKLNIFRQIYTNICYVSKSIASTKSINPNYLGENYT